MKRHNRYTIQHHDSGIYFVITAYLSPSLCIHSDPWVYNKNLGVCDFPHILVLPQYCEIDEAGRKPLSFSQSAA
jgi:hypothetical protein